MSRFRLLGCASPAKAEKAKSADWPLWLVLALGAGLRLLFINEMELWWDEFVTLGRSLPDVPELLYGLLYQSPSPVSTDCSPPLHHLLVHAALQFGHEGVVIRMPGVVFGLVALYFLMRLAQRIHGLRAAVVAGLFCAMSLFHVYYSRDIRWYAVYYGCSLFALYSLYLAVTLDRLKYWLAFCLGSALSLYASYVAAPVLAGECCFLLGLCIARWLGGQQAAAKRLAWRSCLFVALAVLLYSPWLPGQYYAFYSFYGKGSSNSFVLAEFLRSVRFFLDYFYQDGFNTLLAALPLVALGYCWSLAGPRKLGAWLVLAWGIPSVAAAYWVKTEFSVSPKYIMSLFYVLVFGLAFGVEAVARWIARVLPVGRAAAGWTAALVLTMFVGSANLHYAEFYQGKMFSYKAALRQVALEKNNIDLVLYDNERNFSFVGNWYLGDLFERATGVFERRYKRFYYLSPAHGAHVPWAALKRKTEACDISYGAFVNRAPLPIVADASGIFRYADSFKDFQVFQDSWKTDNITVDVNEGVLAPADMSRQGMAVYAFVPASGQALQRVAVRISAVCMKRNVFFPDAAITVLAGNDPQRLAPVGTITAHSPPGPPRDDAAYRGMYTLQGAWDLSAGLLSGKTLYVAVAVSAGTLEGMLKATDFTVEAVARGGPVAAQYGMAQEWKHIYANLSDTERPRAGDQTTPGRLVAFSCDPAVFPPYGDDGLGAQAERRRFLAAFPAAVPVHVIRKPSGEAALEIYDPWLASPYLTLPGDTSLDFTLQEPPAGYKAPGSMHQTLAAFRGQPLPLSCGLPESAVSTSARGGESFIFAQERFDEEAFNPNDLYSLRDIRVKHDAAALTCIGKTPCQATYRFQSLYPLTELVMTTFPRVYCDAAKENFVRVSFSEDAGPFKEIYTLRSDGSGQWRGTGSYPHVDAVALAKGAREVLVRLEMANDGAMWQSDSNAPMMFELFADTSGMPGIAAGSGELANLTPGRRAASLFFLNAPVSAFAPLRPGLTVTPAWRFLFR